MPPPVVVTDHSGPKDPVSKPPFWIGSVGTGVGQEDTELVDGELIEVTELVKLVVLETAELVDDAEVEEFE